jgi:hypothetical protein
MAKQLGASQEGLSSVELVGRKFKPGTELLLVVSKQMETMRSK